MKHSKAKHVWPSSIRSQADLLNSLSKSDPALNGSRLTVDMDEQKTTTVTHPDWRFISQHYFFKSPSLLVP